MKIFPARMGPTVCELLGPTALHTSILVADSKDTRPGLAPDAEQVKSGDDSVLWSLHWFLFIRRVCFGTLRQFPSS